MKKTVLYDDHLQLGAKIVEFGGYLMPLQYQGITEEHLAVRQDCGVFDVSHMGEILVTGPETRKFIEYVFSGKIPQPMTMSYGFLLKEDGGIIDDLMIYYFHDQKILLVVNASNLDKDYQWISDHSQNYQVMVNNISDEISLLAVQGPNAESILRKIISEDITTLKMFDFHKFHFLDSELLISRSGYTGEDGFEIYGAGNLIVSLFHDLIAKGVTPCGLGARDTLRFEAAMPLYGDEISEDINPIEAGLKFGLDFSKDFIGKQALETIMETGIKRKLVALELTERGIARHGYEVEKDGKVIGFITTGYLVPGVNKAYALAYLNEGYWDLGTNVSVRIRKNLVNAIVRNKKFLNKKYKK